MWSFIGQSRRFQKELDDRWQRLYRLAYSWCHDPHLSSDLVQETLLKALKNKHQLKDSKAMDAWLFMILNNCWKDYWRSKKEMVEIESLTFHSESDTELELEQENAVNRIRHGIAQLPINQRQIITLIDLEEMSYKEVATILEIPIGTVMSRLCRARNALKIILKDIESFVEPGKPNLRRIK